MDIAPYLLFLCELIGELHFIYCGIGTTPASVQELISISCSGNTQIVFLVNKGLLYIWQLIFFHILKYTYLFIIFSNNMPLVLLQFGSL